MVLDKKGFTLKQARQLKQTDELGRTKRYLSNGVYSVEADNMTLFREKVQNSLVTKGE